MNCCLLVTYLSHFYVFGFLHIFLSSLLPVGLFTLGVFLVGSDLGTEETKLYHYNVVMIVRVDRSG